MTDLFTPLDETEMDFLDDFLLERIDDETDTEGKDEGVLLISELDGLFTAIVSGPVMIPPSQWLPAVWGDFEPEWKDEKEFEYVFSLMMRHMNVIAAMLTTVPEEFEPMFEQRIVEGRTHTIVDEWCEGYVRGIELVPELWEEGGEQMDVYLIPIYAFTGATSWRAHDLAENETNNLRHTIPECVREIHAYWLARREEFEPGKAPVRRSETHVGRNDPCPCGSGKKYKKCCLH
jgi:uncharacterized protein